MKRSFLLLGSVVILLVLLAAGGKMRGALAANTGLIYLFYCLVLLLSIISVISGVLRMIRGNRSLISCLYIFFSLVVFALAYFLVTR